MTYNPEIGLPGGASSLPGGGGRGASEPKMNVFEFRLFRDYIHDYCGIYFDDAKAGVLASRLSFRMNLLGMSSFTEYYNHLRFSPRSREEIDDLIPHLTNNETYFYREMAQLNFLVDRIITRLRESDTARPLRILSCGCSSGEEAFTLAMLLDEKGAFSIGRRIDITGIDIDRKVIEKASAGEYTSYSLRATDKPRIDKYFTRNDDNYLLDSRIRSRVSFRRGNLLAPETFWEFRGGIDAILCRNVFIYFSDAAILKIVESFHEGMIENGCLLLGHSESLTRITDIFHPERHPSVIFYTKKGL